VDKPARRRPKASLAATATALVGLAIASAVGGGDEPDGHTAGPLAAGVAGAAEPIRPALRSRVVFGRSVEGRRLRAVRRGDRDGDRRVLVVGSIHGDETEGHEVVKRLERRGRELAGAELWIVKSVNPDGAQAGSRKNAHGVDLNRNFPVGWSAAESPSSGYYGGPRPFSEPESRAVRRLVRRIQPRITIWYHQPWGVVLLPCEGPAAVEKRYARVADHPTDRCRGSDLPGTATRWERKHLPGTHFVVELAAGELSDRDVRRHARAAIEVAEPGR
jgi:murein peptide amidase A